MNTQLFGISADSVERHEKFVNKYRLPMTLLSDPEKQVAQAYAAIGWFGIIKRVSFLIDPQGNLAKIYHKVKPAEHAQAVLNDLSEWKETP